MSSIQFLLNNRSWYRYSTWYGFGIRARILLEKIQRNDNAEAAIDELNNELWDQGDRPSAATPTITLLCEMLPFLTENIQVQSMALLVDLALGFEAEQLLEESPYQAYRIDDPPFRALDSKAEVFLTLLDSSNSKVRAAAARVLAWLPRISNQSLIKIRRLADSDIESERLAAVVAQGILKDSTVTISESSETLFYASNAAFCETHPIGERNLEIFLQLAEWTDRQEDKGVLIKPFDFTLPFYGASVLERSSEEILLKFRERAEPGTFTRLLKVN